MTNYNLPFELAGDEFVSAHERSAILCPVLGQRPSARLFRAKLRRVFVCLVIAFQSEKMKMMIERGCTMHISYTLCEAGMWME